MSVAILKRKAMNGNPRLAPISGNSPLGFALNGTRRIKGVVGPTNLGANKRPALGSHQSCFTCNSNEIIKPSVKTTKGMISTRFTGILYGAWPRSTVKPINPGVNPRLVNLCNIEKVTHVIKHCNCDGKVINKIVYSKPGIGAMGHSAYLTNIYKLKNGYLLGDCLKPYPKTIINSYCK